MNLTLLTYIIDWYYLTYHLTNIILLSLLLSPLLSTYLYQVMAHPEFRGFRTFRLFGDLGE